jgi:cyclophilin family peptidyl-prolyl cis-trans isomerase
MVRILITLLGLLSDAAIGAEAPPTPPSPGEYVAAAPQSDWIALSPSDLLVMDLAPDANGVAPRVIIQLLPPPFSQGWVGNIRVLAAAKWWDGTSINRVQDNYVVQWGDASEKKPLPPGLSNMPESDYVHPRGLPRPKALDPIFVPPNDMNRWTSFFGGFPVAGVGTPDMERNWPVHCYGMVGVGRNMPPDTGTGAELYTVIGHAPRHLDRNIALVGRVIEGIEHLASLPRGTGALGFYEKPSERVGIVSIRIGSDLAAAERPRFEYLSPDSGGFARYAESRANRRDAFFVVPAGGADICNIPVPVRRVR